MTEANKKSILWIYITVVIVIVLLSLIVVLNMAYTNWQSGIKDNDEIQRMIDEQKNRPEEVRLREKVILSGVGLDEVLGKFGVYGTVTNTDSVPHSFYFDALIYIDEIYYVGSGSKLFIDLAAGASADIDIVTDYDYQPNGSVKASVRGYN